MRVLFVYLFSIITILSTQAQSVTRSGEQSPFQQKPNLKRFGCEGEFVFQENFDQSSGLPADWQVLDVDGATPRNEIQFITPVGGWQVIEDPRDPTNGNQAIASPSWYEDASNTSNDWLITPQIENLPGNTCFSWVAYAQDPTYPESYEVRISTTGNDTVDFLAVDALLTVSAEDDDFSYYSLDLSAYAGQDIYLAFRHTSSDAFMLVLDDVALADVPTRDLALFSFEPINIDPLVESRIQGSLINRGLDTLIFDSAEVRVGYEVSGKLLFSDIKRSFVLLPNDTLQFTHEDPWTPEDRGSYGMLLFINTIDGDVDNSNDTLFQFAQVGPVSVKTHAQTILRAYPNPAQDQLIVEWPTPTQAGTLSLHDAWGRKVGIYSLPVGTSQFLLPIAKHPAGVYWLRWLGTDGAQGQLSIQKR